MKKTKIEKRGGARKTSGRKPVEDPKLGVTFYCERSIIEANGGIEAVRNECYKFLKSKANS